MNKLLTVTIVFLIFLTGCKKDDPNNHWIPDRCERQRIFLQCMNSLPAGPTATKYNDWDEVVDSCETTARKQAREIQRKNEPEVCS